MTTRTVFGNVSTLVYNYENQLTTVSGATSGSFSYDGDGKRVKGTVGGVTTVYVGNYFEWTSAGSTAYYYAGGQRTAMRRAGYSSDNGLFWLLGDQLGSTTVTANSDGVRTAELRYKPWGQARTGVGTTRTSYRFTGQRSEEAGIALYWYNSRWYDPLLSRWTSPDSIIPQNQGTQAWDRYAYVNNSPVNYIDPTGHRLDDGCNTEGCGEEKTSQKSNVGDPPPGNDIGDTFSKIARGADGLAYVINLYQAGVVDFAAVVLILGGTFIGPEGPTDGITTALAFDFTVSTYTPTAIAENVLGGISLVATAVADVAYGYTDFDNHTIGVDTLVSARGAFMGLFPEVNVDLVVSGYQLGYDLGRRDGTLPGGSVPWSLDAITPVINFYWPDIDF